MAAVVHAGFIPPQTRTLSKSSSRRGRFEAGRLAARTSAISSLGVHGDLGGQFELREPVLGSGRRRRLWRSVSSRSDMALMEEIPSVTRLQATKSLTRSLAYELIRGALVRWTDRRDKSSPETPTAVLIHGILGTRKNWGSFARKLAQMFPAWQFLLVDLRCHGESSLLPKRGPHTVVSAARDVLQLVGQLKLIPRVLIGHSFGGKVVLSMADQAAKPLARPVRVWVLDATPGKVRAGGDGEDNPQRLIEALQEMPSLVPSRRAAIEFLSEKGFSTGTAHWMTTNLKPVEGSSELSWGLDLDGISDMFQSYESTNLWPMVENVPLGVHIDFLRAERSLHRWHHDDVQRIRLAGRTASREGAGVQMHVLEDAGHWVHTDNPEGLLKTLSPSFVGARYPNL